MICHKFHDDASYNLPWQSKLKRCLLSKKIFFEIIKWKVVRGTSSKCIVNLVRSLLSTMKIESVKIICLKLELNVP